MAGDWPAATVSGVRIVLISSPGSGPGVHWSQPAAAELARALIAGGAEVSWFPVVNAREEVPPPPPGIHSFAGSTVRPAPVHRVEMGTLDLPLEAGLTKELRSRPTAAFVHLGAGARGSVNLLWIADRMGVAPFAVVRASEVVCQRGGLIDAGGAACDRFLEPARCRACCSDGWLRRPRASEFENRSELLVAGLQVARAVFVYEEVEAQQLEQIAVPRRVLQVAPGAVSNGVLAARLLAARDALVAPS